MTEQWQELKETIMEMRDNDGAGTQKEVCKFLANYMDNLEKQMQQPCEDCISRNSVTKILNNMDRYVAEELTLCGTDKKFSTNEVFVVDDVYEEIVESLPSVTPQPKVGRWEWVQYDSNPNIGNWHCSECRTIIPHMPEEKDNTPIYKYCPNCGAKMEVQK